MPTERLCRSSINSEEWVFHGIEGGKLRFIHRSRANKVKSSSRSSGSSSQSKAQAYRDTAFWGKDKMTYEELTSAWDDFNRHEELAALYYTQSEAADRILEQVFQNVRIDCEDLDGLKPPRTLSSPSPTIRMDYHGRRKAECGCEDNHSSDIECVAPTPAERHDVEPDVDHLLISPSN